MKKAIKIPVFQNSLLPSWHNVIFLTTSILALIMYKNFIDKPQFCQHQ
ncbi:hypothetical protein CLORAM_00950 [Thomasclavelia ramosa DSM 1402]|uniref:Uncharacterized protein n=1 Tax=Thomasclavelia ramosa DSM 1402 TaxID=445974 RepID=B0N3D1_9FIRM|nr:hypothetical protein CLORAM_00950 [Thomasclavelia ramosa DSM 1402]